MSRQRHVNVDREMVRGAAVQTLGRVDLQATGQAVAPVDVLEFDGLQVGRHEEHVEAHRGLIVVPAGVGRSGLQACRVPVMHSVIKQSQHKSECATRDENNKRSDSNEPSCILQARRLPSSLKLKIAIENFVAYVAQAS